MNKTEKMVYQDTLDLFDNCCALCGCPYVECHHIRYGWLYGGRKTYMGNIIPLCKKHHDMVHTNKNKYMPMLIELVERKMEEKYLEGVIYD